MQTVIIQVFQGAKKPYFYRKEEIPKGVYVRADASTRRADETYLKELQREAQRTTFDEESSKNSIKILSDDLLRKFYGNSFTDERLLNDFVAIRSSTQPNKLEISNCGILHFCINPARYIPEATILCTHFRGTEGREIIKSRELEGPIAQLANIVIELIKDWSTTGSILLGAQLITQTPIPDIALREAVINALVHRRNTIPAPIKIALFENRLEIFSPGNLPGLVTVKNLGDGTTFLRNPRLVNIARKMHLVEKLGSGVRTMYETCRKAHVADPIFTEGAEFVKVTSPFKPREGLDFESVVRKMLESSQEIRIENLVEITKLSRNTVTRKLNNLIQAGLLERIGQGRGTRYVKKSDG
jgi:ATP-dependent DNA helicase RecG